MNNIVEVKGVKVVPKIKTGSLWIDREDGEIFILGMSTPHDYVAISLTDGCRFRDANKDPNHAVDGLRYLGEGLKITVEVPNGQS